jgi:hypothetical protein
MTPTFSVEDAEEEFDLVHQGGVLGGVVEDETILMASIEVGRTLVRTVVVDVQVVPDHVDGPLGYERAIRAMKRLMSASFRVGPHCSMTRPLLISNEQKRDWVPWRVYSNSRRPSGPDWRGGPGIAAPGLASGLLVDGNGAS